VRVEIDGAPAGRGLRRRRAGGHRLAGGMKRQRVARDAWRTVVTTPPTFGEVLADA